MTKVSWDAIGSYGLTALLPALILIVLGFMLVSFLGRQIGRVMARKGVGEATEISVKRLIRWVVGILITLGVVTILGFELTSLWAGVSAVLAIAAIGFFAGWSLISSSLAMFIILVWRPYKIGDQVEILPDGFKGELDDIDLMFCRIVEPEGKTILIANSQMLQKVVRRG